MPKLDAETKRKIKVKARAAAIRKKRNKRNIHTRVDAAAASYVGKPDERFLEEEAVNARRLRHFGFMKDRNLSPIERVKRDDAFKKKVKAARAKSGNR